MKSMSVLESISKTNGEIRVEKLVKKYPGDVVAVDDVSFHVKSGQIFGFLGPNGAGKSTTIKILTTLALPTNGNAFVGGFDVVCEAADVRRIAGVALQDIGLDPMMKSKELLTLQGQLFGNSRSGAVQRAEELLELMRLTDAVDRRVGTYSGGMRRRLDLALALVHKPQILFLDEPTTGIDVASARQIRQLISDLNAGGITIFLTTHYIEEAERLCERVAFIVNGRIVRTDRTADLLQPVKGRNILVLSISDSEPGISEEIARAFPEYQVQSMGQGEVRVESTEQIILGPLVHFLEERGIQVTEARRQTPSLEDIFVQVTGIEAGLMKKEKEKMGGEGNQ